MFISLFSCSAYRTIQVEVLEPAKLPVEKGQRIAFLDRNIRRANSEVTFKDQKSEFDMTAQMIRGMNQIFTEMGFDTVIPLMRKSRTFIEDNRKPKALSADSVNNFCLKYNLDYLIAVEIQEFEVNKIKLTSKWFMRLYQAGTDRPIDSIELQNTFFMESDDKVIPKEILETMFWDEGAKYVKRLVPYWEEVERRVYKQGRSLGLGDYYFKNDDLENAIQVWEGAAKLANRRAIKAGINLAWVYENAGDFDTALTFLIEAEKIAVARNFTSETVSYLKEYIKILTERIRKKEILNQQMHLIGD